MTFMALVKVNPQFHCVQVSVTEKSFLTEKILAFLNCVTNPKCDVFASVCVSVPK